MIIEPDPDKFLKSCMHLANIYSNFEDALQGLDKSDAKKQIQDKHSEYNHKKHMFRELKKVFTNRFIEEYAQTKINVKTEKNTKELCLCELVFDYSQANYEIIFQEENTNKKLKAYKDHLGIGLNSQDLHSIGGDNAKITKESEKYLNKMLQYAQH